MDLRNQQIKDTYGNLATINTVAGTPTTGVLQNGAGSNVTALTLEGSLTSTSITTTNITSSGSALVVNDAGANVDFRVEGDTEQNLLFVDASTDRVGIGTSSITSKLTVVETSTGEAFRIDGDGSGYAFVVNGGTDRTSRIRALSVGAGYVSTTPPTDGLIVDGQVGIGTSSPTTTLHVAGTLRVTDDANFDAGTLFIDASENRVGIGTASPSYPLHVSSNISSVGLYVSSGTYNFVSKFESTDSEAFIVLEDNNSTTDGNRIGVAGDNMDIYTADQQRLRITSSGQLLVGSTSARTNVFTTASPRLQLEGVDTNTSNAILIRNSNDGNQANLILGKTRGTSVGGTTAVQTGDLLGAIYFNGSDGTNLSGSSFITGLVDGTVASGDVPGAIAFWTKASSGSLAERLRITSDGYLRMASGTGGIQFGGDTAAANALDDYEEGTWTPATSTTGYTISSSSGVYTKVGRQVTIRGSVQFSAVNAASNSVVILTGLPFTPSTSSAGSCRESTNSGAVYALEARTTPDVVLSSMDGVITGSQRTIAINELYIFTITYFV